VDSLIEVEEGLIEVGEGLMEADGIARFKCFRLAESSCLV